MPPEDSVANKTVGALNGIPFESIIGGPLSACIKAQAEAAVSTVNFIEAVGLQQGENNTKEAVYVVFSYLQNGRRANISVPLLTIVPIPYIAINNIEIDFKVAINGTEESSLEDGTSTSKMKTSVSSKRDSKSTQDSRFSIEATMDVHVQAGQESMPSGMAKILGMLSEAIDVVPEKGDLTIDGPYTDNDKFYIIVIYKNPFGEFAPENIECSGGTKDKTYQGDGVKFTFAKSTKEATVKALAKEGGTALIERKLEFNTNS